MKIYNIRKEPHDTWAKIQWNTSEKATSQVRYDVELATQMYNSDTALNEELATEHTVGLTDLDPMTTYHFKVYSRSVLDSKLVESSDQEFTTLSERAAKTQETRTQDTVVQGFAALISPAPPRVRSGQARTKRPDLTPTRMFWDNTMRLRPRRL